MSAAEEEDPKARAGHAGDGRTRNLSGVDEKASWGRTVSFNPPPGRQSRKPDGAVGTYPQPSRSWPLGVWGSSGKRREWSSGPEGVADK